MSAANDLNIDVAERFPHLANAPIVEAVIEIRTRAEVPWEEASISPQLKARVPDYPHSRAQHTGELKLTFHGKPEEEQRFENLGWRGLQFQSADERRLAQFNRNSFVFTWLAPYESWDHFSREALRLWQFYAEVAQPAQALRIGVRFINRIELPRNEVRYEDYIQPAPEPPRGMEMPFYTFVHHDVLAVPGHAYAINVIRTIQHPQDANRGIAVILDIDAFTTEPAELTPELLEKRLPEMRWLKNKAFFGSVTPKTLERFQQ